MTERNASVNWDRVYELLYGHPADKPRPKYLDTMSGLAKDINKALLHRSKEIIRQVTLEAGKVGLIPYLQYVFFILMERSREWPSMSRDKREALEVLRSILSRSGNTPTYTDGLKTPPSPAEQNLDKLLLQLATWGSTVFRTSLKKEYLKLVQNHTAAVLRATPGLDERMVSAVFEMAIRKYPNAFPDGHFLLQVFSTLL